MADKLAAESERVHESLIEERREEEREECEKLVELLKVFPSESGGGG